MSPSLQGNKVDISDGNDRPEKVHAGDHSLGICWECDPLHGAIWKGSLEGTVTSELKSGWVFIGSGIDPLGCG